MTAFVLDNSVCMRWCFRDTPTSYADGILTQLLDGGHAHVPVLWLYEVASVLVKGQKHRAISALDASDFLADLEQLSIIVDQESAVYVLPAAYGLAITHGLTGYDAAYLELARRRNLPLATLDEELIRVCKVIGQPLL